MKALNEKRSRLRQELQDAYDLWIRASVWQAGQSSFHDSGASCGAQAQWLDYLAAKERLVLAYADQSPAA